MLYSAARSQLMTEVVQPALDSGKAVLADRFAWSTLAYQGFGRGLDLSIIENLIELAVGELWPTQTFILDLPVDESRRRQAIRNEAADRMELEQDTFFEKVREGYLYVAKKHSDKVQCLSALQSIDEIHAQIMTQMKEFL